MTQDIKATLELYEGNDAEFPCIAVQWHIIADNELQYLWHTACVTDCKFRGAFHYFKLKNPSQLNENQTS